MSFEAKSFRNALGKFATGVCVVTINPDGSAPLGMTINSFASVSLDPALVLWSLQKNSDCYDQYITCNDFAINVLSLEQTALSNQYAKKGEHELIENSYRKGSSNAVFLKESKTVFECVTEQHIEGGDHIIILGRVVNLFNHPAEAKPLIFFNGKYRELK